MSNATDAATGQSIRRGDRVVALVIDRRVGGYPDATTHAAIPGLSPTNVFEPVSLPIRGRYDEFGLVVPDAGQVSVAAVLDLVGEKDWKGFHAKAFGVDGNVKLGNGAIGKVHPVFGEDDGFRERPLGLCIYRESTWETVLSCSVNKDRYGDVETVLRRMRQVKDAASGRGMAWARNLGLLGLEQSVFHEEDGTSADMPDLARALSHREGGDLLGKVAADWLTRRWEGHAPLDERAWSDAGETLGAVWDLMAAEEGLEILGKTYSPSSLTRYGNDVEAIRLALATVKDAGGAVIERVGDWPEDTAGARLEELLAQAEELLAGIRAGLAEVRSPADEDASSGFSP